MKPGAPPPPSAGQQTPSPPEAGKQSNPDGQLVASAHSSVQSFSPPLAPQMPDRQFAPLSHDEPVSPGAGPMSSGTQTPSSQCSPAGQPAGQSSVIVAIVTWIESVPKLPAESNARTSMVWRPSLSAGGVAKSKGPAVSVEKEAPSMNSS